MKVIPSDLRQKRTIIIGAGKAGTIILDEIRSTLSNEINIVGLIDDDPSKQGSVIMGVRVIGNTHQLGEIIDRYYPEVALIAIPSASGKDIERITNELDNFNIDVRIIPGIFELIKRNAVIGSPLRNIEYSDIFNRRPSDIDIDGIMNAMKGKKVLVTGGAGSIGSEIVRLLLELAVEKVYVMDNNENNMMDLLVRLNNSEVRDAIVPIIADITDEFRMKEIFKKVKFDIVYHAAAKKHVYFMELFPYEAIRANIIGTFHILDQCRINGIKRFVMISTDKAVKPTSVMGASKRVCELLVSEYNKRYGLSYSSVRFGNVFGSSGSVIPIFKQQIESGGPLTVTHPEVKRFFMTIAEAARLVIQASVFEKGDQVFVLDMKEQISILEIAKKMLKVYHREDIVDIRFTGLKPGEKLREELYYEFEEKNGTSNETIFSVRSNMRWESYEKDLIWFHDNKADDHLLIFKLKEIVPQFDPHIVPGG